MINRTLILGLLILCACKKDNQPAASGTRYISKVYEYSPAPGQFINEPNIGTAESAQKLIGDTNNLVSLGAYGGYIIFGFDHAVVNSDGNDLAIYGNPAGTPFEWSEPGIIMVSKDDNKNGIPDDTWYELSGSASGIIHNYSITYYNPKATAEVPWKDNQGHTGTLQINPAHNHNYYPTFAANQDSITFTGTLLPNTLEQQGGIYINKGFAWGYADTYSYNSFDISQAADASGNKVSLTTIDFIKVYTAQNNPGNATTGEISTEITGAADLHISGEATN